MGNFFKKADNIYLYFILICVSVFVVMRFFVPLLAPFLLAFLFVAPIYPKLCTIQRKTKIGKGMSASILLMVVFVCIVFFLWYFGCRIFCNIGRIITFLEEAEQSICLFIRRCCDGMEGRLGIRSEEIEAFVLDRITIIIDNIQVEMAPKVMGESFSYVKNLFSCVASIAVTFIATIMLAKDYEKIEEWANRQKGFLELSRILKKVGKLFFIFIKAQLIILLVIGTICAIGFWLLRIGKPIGLGILTGVLDMLPFIGTGIVLVPTAIYSIIKGEWIKAVGCLILYIICALVREFLEPKLIGKKMGIYPIGILLAIYVGVKLYGLKGIILGPVSIVLIMELTSAVNLHKIQG